MKNPLLYKRIVWVMTFAMAGLILLHAAPAAAAIGKIASFKGDVIVQSGSTISKVSRLGTPVNDGDFVATRNGEASITFNDGATMKVNPFTKIQLQERKEQSGAWIFKVTQNARRITCVVGKLWFKSGSSDTKNYLQSPTAVAGLRGSDGDFGYDNMRTYLNMYNGDAAVVGNVIRGFFQNPGIDAATKNAVYQALQSAYNKVQAAQAEPAAAPQKAVDQAQARVQALQVAEQVAKMMQNNPDATVKAQASLALATVSASISSAQATVNVEAAAVAQRAAEDTAKAATDVAAKKAAEDAAKNAAAQKAAADVAQKAAEAAAAEAKAAADAANLAAAQKAAEAAAKAQAEAQRQAEAAKAEAQKGGATVPTTAATTSSVITSAPTTAPTTAPLTTTPTTTPTTTTSSIPTTSICPSPPCR